MFILASSSARRKELLKKITSNFKVIPSNINEREFNFPTFKYASELSKIKAYDIYCKNTDSKVLAVDTIVIFNKKIINKPIDNNDAINILKMLSGNTHYVISGYTFISKDIEITRNVKTIVHFNRLSDELIKEYVSKGLSKGKAGAYGIQDNYPLVKDIIGSYDNVMGLPTEDLIKHIKPYL